MTVHAGTTDDIETCLAIRRAVFVHEQGIALEEDVDGLDEEAIQFLLTDAGTAIGTARMLIEGDIGKIGRVAVLAANRGKGHGKLLIETAIAEAKSRGLARVKLGAQVDATDFYLGLGFAPVGEVFDDAGLPHQTMIRDL